MNDAIEGDNETPPRIEETMQKYRGAGILSTLDLTWQISLTRDSRNYTAFLHGSTLYDFKRIPFGLQTVVLFVLWVWLWGMRCAGFLHIISMIC